MAPKPKPTADRGFRDAKLGGSTGAPPPPPPPPAKVAKTTSKGGAFNAFINAHPSMRGYADQIWKWSQQYGTDPVVMAALYWRESFAAAKASGRDPATITSPAGAVGIGQIMPLHVGEKTPWGHTVTQSDLVNPDFNIHWSTWYFSQQVSKYGTADAAYNQGYNPGYTGPPLTSLLPKGYVPRGGLSPTDKGAAAAEQSAATATAKTQTFDKWAVLDQHGRVKYVSIADPTKPPKNVLKYGGAPLTQSSFNQVWTQTYQDSFAAYTGRQAKGSEIAQILAKAPSVYTLQNQLAQTKDFPKSPVYKSHAPGLVALARQTMGESWKPTGGIIRKAIAQNWDQATFQANLRKRPEYLKGPEFTNDKVHNLATYEAIYGKADQGAHTLINEVTLQGWTPDEFASYLRSQDAYKQTPEYQSKSLAFLGQLGLITGQVPTVGTAPATSSGPVGPNNKRIAGQGSLTGNGLGVQTYAPAS